MACNNYHPLLLLVGVCFVMLPNWIECSENQNGETSKYNDGSAVILNRVERDVGICGGTFTAETGAFTSPNFPSKYDNGETCLYYITVTGFTMVQLTFDFFYLETSDKVSVYNGPADVYADRIGYFYGEDFPIPVTSTGVEMTIKFYSDSSRTYQGFSATYKATNENTFGQCTGYPNTGDSGPIASPGYPQVYTANQNCLYTIIVTSGNKIQLTFHTFETERDTDYVYVYDGSAQTPDKLIGTYSGNIIPPIMTSSYSDMMVLFTSDYSSNYYEGFYATYQLAPPFSSAVCSTDLLTSMGGILVSHVGYPSDYSSPQICSLTLYNYGEYSNIYIKFTAVDVYGCGGGDYIRLDDHDSELGTICDSSHVGLSFTSTTLITLTFNAESHTGTYKGFEAVYALYNPTYGSYGSCDYDTDFRCENYRCIDSSLRMDGYDHCGDNSDEVASEGDGISSTASAWIIILVIIGVIVLLIIVCGGGCYWWQSKTPASKTAPTTVTQRADVGMNNTQPQPVSGYYQPPEAAPGGYYEPGQGYPPPYSANVTGGGTGGGGGGSGGGGDDGGEQPGYYNPNQGYQPQYNANAPGEGGGGGGGGGEQPGYYNPNQGYQPQYNPGYNPNMEYNPAAPVKPSPDAPDAESTTPTTNVTSTLHT